MWGFLSKVATGHLPYGAAYLISVTGHLAVISYLAATGGPAGLVMPLTAMYPMVTVILSWVLLHEDFTLRRLAGAALALGAVWLLSE